MVVSERRGEAVQGFQLEVERKGVFMWAGGQPPAGERSQVLGFRWGGVGVGV